MNPLNTIAKGDGLNRHWHYPWDSTMSFDEASSYADITRNGITHIRLCSGNSGLLIQRPERDTLSVTASCNTYGFAAGEYEITVKVFNSDGSVFMEEMETLVIDDSRVGVNPLPEISHLSPWDGEYNLVANGDLDDQAEFEALLDRKLNDSQ